MLRDYPVCGNYQARSFSSLRVKPEARHRLRVGRVTHCQLPVEEHFPQSQRSHHFDISAAKLTINGLLLHM